MMFVKDNCDLWDKEWRVVPIRETIKVALTTSTRRSVSSCCGSLADMYNLEVKKPLTKSIL